MRNDNEVPQNNGKLRIIFRNCTLFNKSCVIYSIKAVQTKRNHIERLLPPYFFDYI